MSGWQGSQFSDIQIRGVRARSWSPKWSHGVYTVHCTTPICTVFQGHRDHDAWGPGWQGAQCPDRQVRGVHARSPN